MINAVQSATACSSAMKAALRPAARGTVTTHAEMMFLLRKRKKKKKWSKSQFWCETWSCLNNLLNLNNFQSTPSFDELAQPTNTTEPTLQCVVEIGRPILEATRTVNAAPISIVNPLKIGKRELQYACVRWMQTMSAKSSIRRQNSGLMWKKKQ